MNCPNTSKLDVIAAFSGIVYLKMLLLHLIHGHIVCIYFIRARAHQKKFGEVAGRQKRVKERPTPKARRCGSTAC